MLRTIELEAAVVSIIYRLVRLVSRVLKIQSLTRRHKEITALLFHHRVYSLGFVDNITAHFNVDNFNFENAY